MSSSHAVAPPSMSQSNTSNAANGPGTTWAEGRPAAEAVRSSSLNRRSCSSSHSGVSSSRLLLCVLVEGVFACQKAAPRQHRVCEQIDHPGCHAGLAEGIMRQEACFKACSAASCWLHAVCEHSRHTWRRRSHTQGRHPSVASLRAPDSLWQVRGMIERCMCVVIGARMARAWCMGSFIG